MTPTPPPRAPREPLSRTVHGDTVLDEYAWMADRDDPRLAAYLEAENAYTAARTAHVEPLAARIFDEIRARTKETDLSVPVRHGGWWYYGRTVEGLQYGIAGRVDSSVHPTRPVLPENGPPEGEQVVLDENAEAEGHEFFALGASDVSPDGSRLAYAVDVTGDERYDLRVRDLATGADLDVGVTGIGAGVAWSLDGGHLFYTRYDEAWRPFQVWRHDVGGSADDDVLVHQELDETFRVGVGVSRDDRWVVVAVGSSTSTEYRLIDAARPTGEPILVAARRPKVEYDVEPLGDELFVVHNRDRVNFEVARALVADGAVGAWEPLAVTSEDELVTGVDAFTTFLAVSLRTEGQTAIRIVPRDPLSPNGFGQSWDVAFGETLRTVGVGDNPEVHTHTLQVFYTSMVTPPSVGDYDLSRRELTLLKQTEVRGGYDPADYVQDLEWAVAPDGARVPVSVVRRATTPVDGTAAAVLYAYGAYGASTDPWFSVARLSWLDRGVVFAIAHVRGGDELGRPWYDDGRLLHKQHTFDDFVAAGSLLVEKGYAHPDRLGGKGGSAGGLLIGAVANQAPSVFRALHGQVPFVDVLTTMLDPSLPLTAGEWEEWGDPIRDPEAYAYLKAYSPYDNVSERAYPALLVTTNIHDVRVYVTEPAKWVARLRDRATGGPILLRTWMTAGHVGASGRYDAWRETAWEMAVLLDLLSEPPELLV
ncbi:MAG TPA: S9 family peptidase [Lapillicoccus sp.]|nr:S9 family peptidase [Lapillicoccus sp.]